MNLKNLLFKLCSIEKVSGFENNFAKFLKNTLAEFSQKIEITPNNSVIAKIVTKNSADLPEIILTAHLDAIGFIVCEICDNGLLMLKPCGGINLKLASFQRVALFGKKKLIGFTFLKKTANGAETLFVDVGLSKPEVESLIDLGTVANFEFEPIDFGNGEICAKNLDDCAGIATILAVLGKLQHKSTNLNLTVIFSSQEETTGTGITTSAYGQNAKFAICVDVSFAKFHNCQNKSLGEMGKGPMIGIAPTLDLNLTETLKKLAKTKNIPFQLEVMNGMTSTDADNLSKIKTGIRTCLCSIPLKFMHSPIEIIDFIDIEYSANLIKFLIESIYDKK